MAAMVRPWAELVGHEALIVQFSDSPGDGRVVDLLGLVHVIAAGLPAVWK